MTRAFLTLTLLGAPGLVAPLSPPPPAYRVGPALYREEFRGAALTDWVPEREAGGRVTAHDGCLDVDVPKGATLWFRHELTGPVEIDYEATAVQRGGPNDRVSDLNCFWMAQDPAHPDHLLDTPRSGRFADYDTLQTYYVGLGGNGNTTTRFRRYVGQAGNRPLRPQDDRRGAEFLLRPNTPQRLRLIAFGPLIRFYRDDTLLFEMNDPVPYTRGWFGLRTTDSHLEIRHFRVSRLLPAATGKR